MTPTEIAGLIAVAISISAALLAGLLWVIRAVIAMQKEFKPNGGSSTRDTLNEIRTDVREIRSKVDDHIDWHMTH
jgi:hypothetical protein